MRPEFVPNFEIYSDMVYATNGSAVDTVICRGEVVDGKPHRPRRRGDHGKGLRSGAQSRKKMIFICDVMLGKLARYLRMLGLDAPYIRQGESPRSASEGRHTFLLLQRAAAKAGRPGTIYGPQQRPPGTGPGNKGIHRTIYRSSRGYDPVHRMQRSPGRGQKKKI